MTRRIVITGMDLSTSLGDTADDCWSALVAGRTGIRTISAFDVSDYPAKVAAESRHAGPGEWDASIPRSWCRRGVRLFLGVAQRAYRCAGLDQHAIPGDEIGVAAGASVNYVDVPLLLDHFRRLFCGSANLADRREGWFQRHLGDMMASAPAAALKIRGPAFVIDTACAASAHAIGEAFRYIRRGQARAMIAGGASALVNPIGILAFGLIGALSRSSQPATASRPFDRERDGFVLGEGAGAIVLEDLDSARARGARVYAELVGYGSTLNANSLTDPSPDGTSEARAISMALRDGGIQPEEIQYVAAHGTSTPKNDAVETAALKQVFGTHAYRLKISSNKGQIGHTISAAGVCNLICAVKAINTGIVPPTVNLRNPDPQCDLDYTPNESRRASISAALVNAFAFGGQNCALAVRAYPD